MKNSSGDVPRKNVSAACCLSLLMLSSFRLSGAVAFGVVFTVSPLKRAFEKKDLPCRPQGGKEKLISLGS